MTEAVTHSQPGDDQILVETLDEAGRPIGSAEKLAAHQAPGILHRAFSVFLFDDSGRMLLQRRADTKYHSPGVWSNSCCGHPGAGTDVLAAARERTRQELGVDALDLREVATVTYRLSDPLSGLVEYEYNHTFVGRVAETASPDPSEVSDVRFVDGPELRVARDAEPFSAWFGVVFDAARAHLPGSDDW